MHPEIILHFSKQVLHLKSVQCGDFQVHSQKGRNVALMLSGMTTASSEQCGCRALMQFPDRCGRTLLCLYGTTFHGPCWSHRVIQKAPLITPICHQFPLPGQASGLG